jgi:hypothetical protein
MVFRSGLRAYVTAPGTTSALPYFRRQSRWPPTIGRDFQPLRLQLSAGYATDTKLRYRDTRPKEEPSSSRSIKHSRNDIGTSNTSDLNDSITTASRTAEAQSKWSDVRENDSSPKKQEWLSWKFDASVPPQVKSCGWALQVLDVVNGVTEGDVVKLQASVQQYNDAVSRARVMVNEAQRDPSMQYTMKDFAEVWNGSQQDLIKDFTEVWNRSEKRFKAALQEQNNTAMSAQDLKRHKEVAEMLQQVDTSALSDEASLQDVEVRQIPEDLTEVASELPQASGANSTTPEGDQQVDQVDAAEASGTIDLQSPTPIDVVRSIAIDPATLREEEVAPESRYTPSSTAGQVDRFVPEDIEQWLRRTRLEQEIANADREAQQKRTWSTAETPELVLTAFSERISASDFAPFGWHVCVRSTSCTKRL